MIRKIISIYQTQDSVVFWFTACATLITLIGVILYALQYPNLPSKLPLFYSRPWGGNQLIDLNQFLLLPGVTFLIIFINLIISWHLHPSQLLLKRMLSINSLVVALLMSLATVRIIYIFV